MSKFGFKWSQKKGIYNRKEWMKKGVLKAYFWDGMAVGKGEFMGLKIVDRSSKRGWSVHGYAATLSVGEPVRGMSCIKGRA